MALTPEEIAQIASSLGTVITNAVQQPINSLREALSSQNKQEQPEKKNDAAEDKAKNQGKSERELQLESELAEYKAKEKIKSQVELESRVKEKIEEMKKLNIIPAKNDAEIKQWEKLLTSDFETTAAIVNSKIESAKSAAETEKSQKTVNQTAGGGAGPVGDKFQEYTKGIPVITEG